MPVSYHGGVSRPFVQPEVFKGATEPQTPNLGDLWVDLSGVTPDLKQCFALSPLTWTSITPYNLTSLVINSGTITASTPAIIINQTWNNGAVTFTASKVNVTNTASASASKLQDWQVGGSSKCYISAAGVLTFVGSDAEQIRLGNASFLFLHQTGLYGTEDGRFGIRNNSWSRAVFVGLDDANNTFAQRNGTNAQTLRVYGTYTDSSNYVRASLASSSTAVTLAAETAGTGADNVPVNLTPAGTEGVVIGNFAQFTEMTAPAAGAANTARLFCEDNGAGKTRLMVQFASGSPVQVAIEV